MIRWTRSVRISSGKQFPQAMKWAKEIAQFVEQKHEVQTGVYMDILERLTPYAGSVIMRI